MKKLINSYKENLKKILDDPCMDKAELLAEAIYYAWKNNNCVYLCGNGGSAANAIHIANDLLYGAGRKNGKGINVEALSSNVAVLTCLANDLDYSNIYSEQIKVKAKKNDILIALSGSGNSKNIINAIKEGNHIGMKTFAILGYSGGECKKIANTALHFDIADMQICEDSQLIIGHMCMQWLSNKKI